MLVPATRSDSNDNKTIHYTAAHEIICRGCIDRDNNVPLDVLIAPENNGLDWISPLVYISSGMHICHLEESHLVDQVAIGSCLEGSTSDVMFVLIELEAYSVLYCTLC